MSNKNNNSSDKLSIVAFLILGALIGLCVDIFIFITESNGNTWWTIVGLIIGGIIGAIIYCIAHALDVKVQNEFEQNVYEMSKNFAKNELTLKIIDDISNRFIHNINAMDRPTHLQNIDCSFCFDVHNHEVFVSDSLSFKFSIERYRDLNGSLEQHALAKAIASGIQHNIKMEYPKDPSGTNYVINTTYEQTNDHVRAYVTYTAPNGNYRTIRDWQ